MAIYIKKHGATPYVVGSAPNVVGNTLAGTVAVTMCAVAIGTVTVGKKVGAAVRVRNGAQTQTREHVPHT